MSNDIEREVFEAGWAAYCAAPTARDMGRSKVEAAIHAALQSARSKQGEAEPVGHFYNRPQEGRCGVEWCTDHLDDGAALFAHPPTGTVGGVPELTGRHHDLKTDPGVFRQSINGAKPWEIRRNDRDFRAGDTVTLHETAFTGEEMLNGVSLEYTGRTHTGVIGFVLEGPVYGIAEGWCVFSLLTATPSPEQIGGVPNGWVLVPADHLPEKMEQAAVAAAREYTARTGGNCMKTIYQALVNAAPEQGQAAPGSGWIRCSERLPTGADADCNGCVWFCWPDGNTETRYYKRVQLDIHHDCLWMPTGLKRPNPPTTQGGE